MISNLKTENAGVDNKYVLLYTTFNKFKGQRMLISDNAGYKLYCETRKLDIPADSVYVRIYTKYEWAKDPESTHNKLELVLSLDELEKLRQSLSA